MRRALGSENRRLLFAFGAGYGRLFLALGPGDGRLSFAFRLQHERAAIAFRGHLLLHRDADVFRRIDVLHIDAGNLHSPFVGGFIQDHAKLGIDLIALRQGVVQIHIAHHGAHAGDGQLDNAAHQVVHLIDGFDRIGDLPVHD